MEPSCPLQQYTNQSVHPVVILLHQTPGSQLLRLQKQLRDELAKCSAAVFMVDDTAILENVQRKVQSIHSELLSTSSICEKEEELLILKNLMKEVSQYRRKSKVIARANQLTRRCKKLKRKSNTGCPIQTKPLRLKDDPLNAATRPSVGRPKSKKADMNKKMTGTGMSHPVYHQYFPSTFLLFTHLAINNSFAGNSDIAFEHQELDALPNIESNKVHFFSPQQYCLIMSVHM